MAASPVRFRWRSVTSTALGVSALVGALALLIAPKGTTAAPPAVVAAAPSVAVTEVDSATPVRELRFSGVVRAHRRAQLGFVLAGRVTERLAELGDHVERGQPLVRLDRRQLRRSVESANAVVARAKADVAYGRLEQGRVAKLSAVQAVGAAAGDDADHTVSVASAARRQASAAARAARRDLAEGELLAPFSGRITRVAVEPGELVSAGRTVLEIVGDDALELEVQLPESTLTDIKEGQSVEVEFPLLGRTVTGTVTTIAAAAPQSAGLFPVIVTLPDNTDLRAGLTARLVLAADVAEGLVVPVEAVVNRSGDDPRVLAVHDDRVAMRPVQVLAIAGRHAVIEGELEVGDTVVTRGHAALADGDKVTVRR